MIPKPWLGLSNKIFFTCISLVNDAENSLVEKERMVRKLAGMNRETFVPLFTSDSISINPPCNWINIIVRIFIFFSKTNYFFRSILQYTSLIVSPVCISELERECMYSLLFSISWVLNISSILSISLSYFAVNFP